MFEILHEVDLAPIMKYEGFMLYTLDRILRHNTSDVMKIFKALFQIEKNISNILLSTGSIFKFIYQVYDLLLKNLKI